MTSAHRFARRSVNITHIQDAVDGITALHVACCAISLDIENLSMERNLSKKDAVAFLKKLVQQVHSLDAVDVHGQVRSPSHKSNTVQTPLHFAIASGQPDFAKVLIRRGASMNVQDKGGSSPLHLATRLGHHSCIKVRIQSSIMQTLVAASLP